MIKFLEENGTITVTLKLIFTDGTSNFVIQQIKVITISLSS